ncbi:MAG: FAD-dependent oxidoreductase [Chitinophagales bacterium]
MMKYRYLFSPAKVGDLVLENRVIMPAMATGLASYEGEVTPEIIAYYKARAQSAPGAIVVEITCVDAPRGKGALCQLRIDHPRYLGGLSRLADAIKSGGSRAFIQLHHAGRQGNLLFSEGQPLIAPSAIACRMCRVTPKEASLEEIHSIRDEFISAAWMAQEAGFDGIELHAAHGYLLSQFISPYTNKREDEYGGSTEGRTRLLTEIISSIKSLCPKMVLGVRLNLTDFVPGGLEIEEGTQIAGLVEKAGADYISASCGIYESGLVTIEPVSYQEGWRIYLAQKLKECISIPVIGGGVIRHPEVAENIISSGKADLVFVGRNQIADEKWVARARNGEDREIRPCLSCNTCIGRTFKSLPICCSVNPRVGRETWLHQSETVKNPQRVMIVGGGPGGLRVSALLARQGHQVTLIEKELDLGGMLNVAARPPYKQRLFELKEYLIRETQQAGTEIITGQDCNQELVKKINPEIAIIATGSTPRTLPNQSNSDLVVQAVDILKMPQPPEDHRVVVVGGGLTGCETALFLAQAKNKVTLVEAGPTLAPGMENMSRLDLVRAMKKAGVKSHTGKNVKKLEPGKVVVIGATGEEEFGCDLVVLALGFEIFNPVKEFIQDIVGQVYYIGDVIQPQNIECALREADMLAQRISYCNGWPNSGF